MEPSPSNRPAPDPSGVTRRTFVRLVGGTNLAAHAGRLLRLSGPAAAVVGVLTGRVYAAAGDLSACFTVNEDNPGSALGSTNPADVFVTEDHCTGTRMDTMLVFDDLQGFFTSHAGSSFHLVLTLVQNGLNGVSSATETIVARLVADDFSGLTQATATWNDFSPTAFNASVSNVNFSTLNANDTAAFNVDAFVGRTGSIIRLLRANGGTGFTVRFASANSGNPPMIVAVAASATPTPTNSPTPSQTPSATPTPSPSASAAAPTPTPSPSASANPTPTPTPSPSASAAPTPTPTPTPPASFRPVPTATPQPTRSVLPGAPILSYAIEAIGDTAAAAATGQVWGTSVPTDAGFRAHGAASVAPLALRPDAPGDASYTVRLTWLPPSSGTAPTGYQVEAGTEVGASNLTTWTTDASTTSLVVATAPGTYYARVRARNAFGLGPASNEVQLRLAETTSCTAPPDAPGTLQAMTADVNVTLSWGAATGASTYLMEVGSTPGATDLARQNIGGLTQFVAQAPPGTYYIRIRGTNACGTGPASNEVEVTVTSILVAPNSPSGLGVRVDGRTVTLSWQPPVGGGGVEIYIVEVGLGLGLTDVGTMVTSDPSVVVTGAPPGTYFARVRARNASGISVPTPDVQVDVF
ncbi:MAG: hypothetical protein AB7O67_19715 [Vicinamibacterales bacterium]